MRVSQKKRKKEERDDLDSPHAETSSGYSFITPKPIPLMSTLKANLQIRRMTSELESSEA